MAATLTDPLLGHLIDGRYEVLSRIARGGMATVYLAVDRRLDREVAIKVMHPHLAEGGAGSEFVARFRREARAAARLTHPGLVGVFDQGIDGETSYLTMEYIEGTNLRRHLAEQGALTVDEAFTTVEAILEALGAAHRIDLVHRDIKPENVLLASDGRIKVADFGLARAVTEVTSTTTGTVLGTVAYLAPELVAHGESDARTDVYAVGILLYEMLTGTQPFTGATPIQIAYQHVHEDVPAPSAVVPWLPVEVDELVGALAAREPDDRPLDAAQALQLVHRTREALDDETLARRADVAPSEPPTSSTNDADGPDSPADDDPDATAALAVPHRRTARGRPAQDVPSEDDDARDGLSRTMALPIGAGVGTPDATPTGAPDDDGEARPRRRRLSWLLLLAGLVVVLGGGTWWFLTSGPGAYTTVPAGVVDVELAAAQEALTAAGLESVVTEDFDPEVPVGVVVDADPGPGDQVRKDGSVQLTVSLGPDLRPVPAELVGQPVDDVVAALQDAGFDVPDPVLEHSDTTEEGLVLAVTGPDGVPVEPGSELPVDTELIVTVSDGPAPITFPTVVGQPKDLALADLAEHNLEVTETTDYSEEYAEGIVMAQDPAGGTDGFRGDAVTITISQGPPLVEVPDLFGMQYGEARTLLEELGLEVTRENVLGGLFGTVREQSIEEGETVPMGTAIQLTVV